MTFLSVPFSRPTVVLTGTPGNLPDLIKHTGKLTVTRARLQAMLSLFAPLYGKYSVKYDTAISPSTDAAIKALLTQRTMPSLDNCISAAKVLLGNPDNIRKAVDALPVAYRKILDRILATAYISASDAQSINNDNLEKYYIPTFGIDIRRSTFTSVENALMPYMRMVNNLNNYTNGYTLEYEHLGLIGRALELPKYSAKSATTDVLPDAGLTTFDGSDEILSQLNILIDNYRSGNYVSYSGKPVKLGEINEMAIRMHVSEIFPSARLRTLTVARMRILLSMFASGMSYLGNTWTQPADNATAFKQIYDHLHITEANFAALIMPHIKNITKACLENMSKESITVPVMSVLKKYTAADLAADQHDRWISAEDLVNEVLTQSGTNFRDWLSIMGSLPYNSISENGIFYDDLYREWYTQLVLGYLGMLAAMGLTEIALRPMLADTPAPWSAIQYVRMTRLGRFVFGTDKRFTGTIKEFKPDVAFELDPDRLIITVLDEKVLKFLKASVGQQITSTRIEVNTKTFMRKIDSARDLNERIKTLAQMGSISKFPHVWQLFFESLKDKFNAIKYQSLKDYVMFEITSSDAGLLQLLVSNSEISKLIIPAEGRRILVRNNDIKALNNILAAYGYRLPDVPRYIW